MHVKNRLIFLRMDFSHILLSEFTHAVNGGKKMTEKNEQEVLKRNGVNFSPAHPGCCSDLLPMKCLKCFKSFHMIHRRGESNMRKTVCLLCIAHGVEKSEFSRHDDVKILRSEGWKIFKVKILLLQISHYRRVVRLQCCYIALYVHHTQSPKFFCLKKSRTYL